MHTSRSVTSARRPMGICVIHSLAKGFSASDCTSFTVLSHATLLHYYDSGNWNPTPLTCQ